MSKYSAVRHLHKEEIVKNGSIFTPKHLTEMAFDKCKDIISSDTIILDMGSGYGAFISEFTSKTDNIVIGTEYDDYSYEYLTQEFPTVTIIHENSLINIRRNKYGLTDEHNILITGNPPYNDITSQYKKGNKGKLNCDNSVVSRDFGVSFLKAYNELSPNYICVLHPLAYLIKKPNFNSLGLFKDNYRLVDSTIFSSKEFETIKKTNSDFPVVAALYEKDESGMDYEYIRNFQFDIYGSSDKFVLSEVKTIDGIIPKYPSKKKTEKLQFYTLRDMNALLRNAGFVSEKVKNGVDVSLHSLYQYSWLYFLKKNLKPGKYKYLYGNLSPLYTESIEREDIKNKAVSYAYNNCELVRQIYDDSDIRNFYGKIKNSYEKLTNALNGLYMYA